MQYITILDYVLLPFFLAIVYAIAYNIRNRRYPRNHPWRKYFIPGLTAKILGAIFIGLVYQYYYKGGDTIVYFAHGQFINEALDESVSKWFNLLMRIPAQNDGAYYEYISRMNWYSDPSSYSVCAITAFLSLLTLNTYLPCAVLFAFISFSGMWALFRTFAKLYPQYTRQVAISVLFIPSTFVWGSGIFKDTLCMFALGWLTYGVFRFLVQRDFRGSNILITFLSFYLILKIKLYILLGFVPALLIWILFSYTQKMKSSGARFLLKTVFLAATAIAFFFFMNKFSQELGKYSLDKIAQTSYITRDYIHWVSGDEGSAYSLGTVDPSVQGMLVKFPLAVNVTLFRPYIWETKKVIVFLSGIEAILFLFATLKVIFVVGLRRIWTTISKDPNIQFCLIFAVIFAFAVGISSYNFGTLSRYKIPCLPFYAIALVLIYYKNKPKKMLIPFLKV